MEKLNHYKVEEKVFKAERQRIYKDMLDDQLRDKTPYNLNQNPNEAYYSPQVIEKKIFPSTMNPNELQLDDHSYQHKTNIYNVNPCTIIYFKL